LRTTQTIQEMPEFVQFGDFVVDPSAYQLRRGKRAIKLERLPMELLLLLLERRGELITRDQIVARLWGRDVFVDIENGINTAVRKLRLALHDDPRRPRYIETVAAKGYRFITPPPISEKRASQPVTLAVLPFENLSGDPSQDYFADGLTEETIAVLGAIGPDTLGVIARTSSMSYKRTAKTISQIGRELGVQFVLESSVRRDHDRVRVTAQLIRVKDQSHVWAKSFDSSGSQILDLQAHIARAIAEQVQIRITPRQQALFAKPRARNADSYDAYLHGRFYWNQRALGSINRAIEHFHESISIDPGYSAAHAGLADAYALLPITSDARTSECLPPAREAATAAVRCDPSSAEAHCALAACKFWMEWDWITAEAEARRAIELNGSFALAHLVCAHILSNSGRQREAEAEITIAKQLDPLSSHVHSVCAQLVYHAGRYDDAEASVRKALVLSPKSWIAHTILGKIELATGRLERAMASFATAFELAERSNTEPLSLQAYCYARQGKSADAHRILEVLADLNARRYVPPYNIAIVHAGLQDDDSAVRWLQRAHTERDVRMVFLPVDPKWASLNRLPCVRLLWPFGAAGKATA
jgi:TolB-like protein/Tfp pilus assembly protein PilF